jgi:micrococcal nuclease
VALCLVLLAMLAAAGPAGTAGPGGAVRVVNDGDDITLTDKRRVRLAQIDSPEIDPAQCYGREARAALLALTPVGSTVVLEADRRLDKVDVYNRQVRYVHRGAVNVNLELVRRGAAAPYFPRGIRGRYAARLMSAAEQAKAANLGLWGACPGTPLDPTRPVQLTRTP